MDNKKKAIFLILKSFELSTEKRIHEKNIKSIRVLKNIFSAEVTWGSIHQLSMNDYLERLTKITIFVNCYVKQKTNSNCVLSTIYHVFSLLGFPISKTGMHTLKCFILLFSYCFRFHPRQVFIIYRFKKINKNLYFAEICKNSLQQNNFFSSGSK